MFCTLALLSLVVSQPPKPEAKPPEPSPRVKRFLESRKQLVSGPFIDQPDSEPPSDSPDDMLDEMRDALAAVQAELRKTPGDASLRFEANQLRKQIHDFTKLLPKMRREFEEKFRAWQEADNLRREADRKQWEAWKKQLDPGMVIFFPQTSARVGQFGRFQENGGPNMRVKQVVSQREAIVSHLFRGLSSNVKVSREFILRGYPTKDWVDGLDVLVTDFFEISGTETYETVTGASKTVFLVEPFNLEEARPYIPK